MYRTRLLKEGDIMAKWIVVSGLDGSGKTTLVNDLEKWMTENGKRVKSSRLPYDEYLAKTLLNVSNDPYTDRMLFALDNRLFAEHYKKWQASNEFDIILTQRGFLDSFIHRAVQGNDYSWIAELNQLQTLPKCDVIIHMVAEARIAYERIKDDPDADKFEYLPYIRRQEEETRTAYSELVNGNSDLEHFANATNIYLDTTQMTTEEAFELTKKRLLELEII